MGKKKSLNKSGARNGPKYFGAMLNQIFKLHNLVIHRLFKDEKLLNKHWASSKKLLQVWSGGGKKCYAFLIILLTQSTLQFTHVYSFIHLLICSTIHIHSHIKDKASGASWGLASYLNPEHCCCVLGPFGKTYPELQALAGGENL